MAKENEKYNTESKLLDCQKLDFTDSECGARIQPILGQFRDETNAVMCEVFVEMQRQVLSLYEALSSNESTATLAKSARTNLEASDCIASIAKHRKDAISPAASSLKAGGTVGAAGGIDGGMR